MNYDAKKGGLSGSHDFDRPALFAECRIDRTYRAEGRIYRYELRHGDEDWGDPVSLSGISWSITMALSSPVNHSSFRLMGGFRWRATAFPFRMADAVPFAGISGEISCQR